VQFSAVEQLGSSRRLAGAPRLDQLPPEVLNELPCSVGVVFEKPLEVPHGHREATQLRGRGHGGRARLFRNERQLAKVVTRLEPPKLIPVNRDSRLSFDDDEEAHTAYQALAEHRHSGAELALLTEAAELPELPLVEVAEKRDPLQLLLECCHSPIVMPRFGGPTNAPPTVPRALLARPRAIYYPRQALPEVGIPILRAA